MSGQFQNGFWCALTGQSLHPNTLIQPSPLSQPQLRIKEPWHGVKRAIRNNWNVTNISHSERLYTLKTKHVVPRDNDFLPRSISLFIRSIKALFILCSTSMCLCPFSICLGLFRALSPLSPTKMNETLGAPLLPPVSYILSVPYRCSANLYNRARFESYIKSLKALICPIKN